MESASQQAGAIFSDVTSSQLLVDGARLIADAFSRLSIQIGETVPLPPLTRGFMICDYDRLPWEMKVRF